jgi:hypothetical protein
VRPSIEQQRVATADDHRRMGRDFFIAEKRREQVTFDVVDGKKRLPRSDAEALRGCGANEQGGGKTRSSGGGDGVEIVDLHACFLQGEIDDCRRGDEMVSGCHLGNNAAELRVDFRLAENLMRQHIAEALQHGSGCFIAGSLDREQRGHLFFLVLGVLEGALHGIHSSLKLRIPDLGLGGGGILALAAGAEEIGLLLMGECGADVRTHAVLMDELAAGCEVFRCGKASCGAVG